MNALLAGAPTSTSATTLETTPRTNTVALLAEPITQAPPPPQPDFTAIFTVDEEEETEEADQATPEIAAPSVGATSKSLSATNVGDQSQPWALGINNPETGPEENAGGS